MDMVIERYPYIVCHNKDKGYALQELRNYKYRSISSWYKRIGDLIRYHPQALFFYIVEDSDEQ